MKMKSYHRMWIIFGILPVFLETTLSNMNFYMTGEEVKRVLGLPAELFYVREDEVREAALEFNMPVRAEIKQLYFFWYTDSQVYYSMSLKSENQYLLRHPTVNITYDGEVPKVETVFAVSLDCTGNGAGEVGVLMQVNLTLHSAVNLTVLNFKRRKHCLRDKSRVEGTYRPDLESIIPPPDKIANASVAYTENSDIGAVTSTSMFYIAVGIVCGIILMLVMLVAFVHVKSMRASDQDQSNGPQVTTIPSGHNAAGYTKPTLIISNGGPNGKAYTSLYHEHQKPEPVDYHIKLADIIIEENRLSLGDVLLEGTFGRVYRGKLIMSNSSTEEYQDGTDAEVFIKAVTDQASEEQKNLLLRESCMLRGLSHKNILSIMNVCLEGKPIVIFPYMNLGNLKQFLRNGRIGPGDTHQSISTRDLVQLSIQITHGMMYLGKRKIVHRDLAARNCVIDEDYNLKITDNALARDLFPGDYHCLGDNENRPVKWMAIESLIDRRFSTASDVWSFAVLLWELVTLGQTPYIDLDPFEMASYLKSGYRMAQPPSCPDELFSLMACCWALMPQDRPKFTQLCAALTDFHRALGIYI
ncbi:tyrosine-protein kinase RYK-like [Amphiura filiformis]|uniref:tyrosine-protein kinase RYK-like n=1 Tax=Amphiura filiformis TaxID=82378 RepID=UPI003B22660B